MSGSCNQCGRPGTVSLHILVQATIREMKLGPHIDATPRFCSKCAESTVYAIHRFLPTTAAPNSAEAHQGGSSVEGCNDSGTSTGGAGVDEPSGGRV